jgi:hypothetical protein
MPLTGIIGALDDERPYMERITEVRPDFRPVILPGLDHLGTWRSAVFPELAGEGGGGRTVGHVNRRLGRTDRRDCRAGSGVHGRGFGWGRGLVG